MALQRSTLPLLVRRLAAPRAVLSCLVVVLLSAGPVTFCDGQEHVVGVSDPRPGAAAQRQPETAIPGGQENPRGRSNRVSPVGAQSASDVLRGGPRRGCHETGDTRAVSPRSWPVAVTDAAQPRSGTLIPDSAGPRARPPASHIANRPQAPLSWQALTLTQLSVSRT